MTPEQMRIALAKECGLKRWQDEETGILSGDWSKYIWTQLPHTLGDAIELPSYDTDANAALEIVAMMRERGWNVTLENGLDGTWEALFHKPDYEGSPKEHRGVIQGKERVIYYGAADTVQLAICEAACAALPFDAR